MHVAVVPCINALGEATPPLIVIPLLKSCKNEFTIATQAQMLT